MPVRTSTSRGLVPLGPLALVLVLPCVAGGAEELSRASADIHLGAWTTTAVTIVVGVGLALGAAGVLVARRWRRARELGAWGEVAAILLAIGLGCGVLATGRALESANVPRLVWVEREDALRAVAAARDAGKPVIVDIEATWCTPYVRFDDDTPEHGRLRAEAARFVRVHVDASDDEQPVVRTILGRFGVIGTPTILVLDGSGKEAARFDTYTPPETLRAALEGVH